MSKLKILLYTNGDRPTDAYVSRLNSMGIECIVRVLPVSLQPVFSEKDFKTSYLEDLADYTYDLHQENVDVIQLLVKKWKLPNGIKGKQYYQTYAGYQIAVLRETKEWEKTAEHEIAHSWDNICSVYTGASLGGILGVQDYDRDIVHKYADKGRGYENDFDEVYAIVRPYVEAAVAKRRLIQLQNLLTKLLVELRKARMSFKPTESLVDDETVEEAQAPVPAPDVVPEAQQRLYDAAYSCLGKNMTSSGVPVSLGCASSLNNVFKKAFGTVIGGGASTAEMFRILKADPRFREVSKPALGDIAMNASGTSTKGVPNGHVGIWGKNSVMSNNSLTGKWDAHYTLKGWVDFFENKKGFKTRYFRVK